MTSHSLVFLYSFPQWIIQYVLLLQYNLVSQILVQTHLLYNCRVL